MVFLLAAVLEAIGGGNPVQITHTFQQTAEVWVLKIESEKTVGEDVFSGAIEENAVHAFASNFGIEEEGEAGQLR